MEEIQVKELQELIDALKSDLRQLSFILENGATLKEYCDNKNDLINDYNYLMKRYQEYVDQEDFKRLEELESEIY